MSSCSEAFGTAVKHLPKSEGYGYEGIVPRFCDAASGLETTTTITPDNIFDAPGPG